MVNLRGILFLVLFGGAAISAYAGKLDYLSNIFASEAKEPQENTKTIEITLNYNSKIKLENVPVSGYLEVYSILGVKVRSINLKTIVAETNLDLQKGVYILKAGKVAQKVIVK
ncbi:T9SS type A sorting domain-containing protein [Prevotella sp. 10(H)]|uniref:T9SS type A sorting domain-containing protein n=1 Tax=Prevotella sp. 10(H) TaxID=1158294 RepID=UPI0004A6B7FE|nr:T9SS type A sorting domain-containing protein [Prevotella sp. 10(H)]